MKVVAIVQARMGSSRLPNKVIKPINGKPLIELLLERLSRAQELDQIIVATSKNEENTPLTNLIENLGYQCFRGNEDNVLDRYYRAAMETKADTILRVTGDCPLVDPKLVDQLLQRFKTLNADYLSNISPATYPDGLDLEAFTFEALKNAALNATTAFDKEHVTPYLRKNPAFQQENLEYANNLSALRWTVDEPEDLEVIRNIFSYFHPRTDFCWEEVLALTNEKQNLFAANQQFMRNEGKSMSTGQKLWRRAKKVIPGGNMLLSKRPEMFLPEKWPAYFSKAKGCHVWDLDGVKYTDMSIMGVGTNILGYGHEEVDNAVRETVTAGNMSTFNCPEEVYLAERLVDIHPWADMVRFARSGGEANAIAIRIARAASGKDAVAFCGYHGWHDWYLSANLADNEQLDGHLLPGLKPNGVPRQLGGTVLPFEYNDYEGLKQLVDTHDIGVIKMEVSRNTGPKNDFLNKVRTLATERGIVLIFDECTSGFRQSFGGLHKIYDVEPDMAVFGKAMGNGYSITSVLGRREVMEAAQSTFISSTFWTERIGPAAALKTLEIMESIKAWEQITATGLDIRQRWDVLATKHDLAIAHWGLPALTGFSFKSHNALAYKTLITQEMLKKGFLAGNSVYVCTEHNPEVIDAYCDALDPVFELIKSCDNEGNIEAFLEGPQCHSGFKRLN